MSEGWAGCSRLLMAEGAPELPKMDLSKVHVAVIGAGMAGLSAATALVRRGAGRVEVFDSEALVFAQSSGRNAAIFRPLENDRAIARLATESLPLLHALGEKSRSSLLNQCGLLLLHQRREALSPAHENAQALGIACEWLSAEALSCLDGNPQLHPAEAALWSPAGGVLDPHAIGQALQRELREASHPLHLQTSIEKLLIEDGRCRGFLLEGGKELAFDVVVLAAGASSARLAFAAGSPLPLLNLQRHLALLETAAPLLPEAPVVWQMEPEVYFRPESGFVLASPCDESPRRSETPQASIEALSLLETHLSSASRIFHQTKLRRYWACIRTKAPDTRPVIGEDQRIEGLYWLAALGGYGMSCGLAAGERLALCVEKGETEELFSPARFRHGNAHS